ncbi:MAG: hypothetical protein ACOYNP_02930 [Gemmataceae bacterium]|jgi:hypothetical protein
MKTVTPPERGNTTVSGSINIVNVSRGHLGRRTGAGVHSDKRTKRCKVRSARLRRAMAE